MSRPAKFEDLNDYNQQGPMVATFSHVNFLSLPWKTLIRVRVGDKKEASHPGPEHPRGHR